MSRSLKKGPFVAYHLLKKIDKLNAAGKKDVITTWSRTSTILPNMIGIQLLFIMVDSMCQFLFQSNLLVIN